jgi:hypothetical protein
MKIFDDTLKKPNGKWDYRKITMFLFTILGALTGVFIVVSDYFLTKEINPYAIGVTGLFLTMASGQSIVATWNKKIDKNLNIDQEQPYSEGQ